MKFETERIINSNGQRYRVGWDEYGWFTIQPVDRNPHADADPAEPEWLHAENSHGEPHPLTSFTAAGAKELVDAIRRKEPEK